MANAIRIVLGLVMLYPAIVGIWFFIAYLLASGAKPTIDWRLLEIILFILAPAFSSYLLLKPKSNKQAWIGLGIGIAYAIYFFVYG